jgi:O-antigen/teichoic acid export membrane protein
MSRRLELLTSKLATSRLGCVGKLVERRIPRIRAYSVGVRTQSGMRNAVRARTTESLARARTNILFQNSVYGIATVAITAVLGYVFWTVAARLYPARDIGLAAAVISAFTLASTLSNLGVGSGLIHRLPTREQSKDWSLTVNAALVVGITAAIVASAVGLVVVPRISPALALVSHPAYAAAFVLGVVLWTVSTVLDFLFIAERTVKLMLVRNSVFGVVKIVVVVIPVLLAPATPLGILLAWVLSIALSVSMAVRLVRHNLKRHWTPVFAGMRTEVGSVMGSLIRQHLINLGAYMPMYVFPLLVTARLGVVDNAYAYIGWMIGGTALIVSPTVAASLFAEGARDPTRADHHIRRGMVMMAILMGPPMVALFFLAKIVLGVFGPHYASHSLLLVQLMIVSAIPDAVTNAYVVRLRVTNRLNQAVFLNTAMGLGALLAAWIVLPSAGIAGLGYAWLGAQTAGSVFAGLSLLRDRRISPPRIVTGDNGPELGEVTALEAGLPER